MNKIYLIGFAYCLKPSFPYIVTPECGFYLKKEDAQKECDRRNQNEEIVNNENPGGFTRGFWSIRECIQNP